AGIEGCGDIQIIAGSESVAIRADAQPVGIAGDLHLVDVRMVAPVAQIAEADLRGLAGMCSKRNGLCCTRPRRTDIGGPALQSGPAVAAIGCDVDVELIRLEGLE